MAKAGSRAARARMRGEKRQARSEAHRDRAGAATEPLSERERFVEELIQEGASWYLVDHYRGMSDAAYLDLLARREQEEREREEQKRHRQEAAVLGQIDLGDEGGPLLSLGELQQVGYPRKFREPGEFVAGVVVGIGFGPVLVFGNGNKIVPVEFTHTAALEAVVDVRPGDYVSAELLRRRGQEGATRHEFEIEHLPKGSEESA